MQQWLPCHMCNHFLCMWFCVVVSRRTEFALREAGGMEVSPPRPEADGGVRAEEMEPVSPPKGCFPNFFSRKKGSRGATKRRKRGLRLGRGASGDARPTPISSPVAKGTDGSPTHAPDAATPAASTVSTATAGSSYMTDHHDVRGGDSIASVEEAGLPAPPLLPSVVSGASTLVQSSMVAFKSPVVIQEQAAGLAMAGGSVSRQSSAGEPPNPPSLGGMQRSFSAGGSLWRVGASLSRGMSMEDLNGMFSRQGSKMKRSMSRR